MRIAINKTTRLGFSLICFLALSLPAVPSAGGTETRLSFGEGPIELFIFSDYFCPPCQKIEPFIESHLPGFIGQGVKVTFVDVPVYRKTELYSKYYLLALQTADGFDEVLRIRRILFDLAKNEGPGTDQDLIRALKENSVDFRLSDLRPLLDRWAELIAKFEVKSTPTGVVVIPDQGVRKYRGGKQIREGLEDLKRLLSNRSSSENTSPIVKEVQDDQ